jgi:hypothetical protein
MGTVARTRASGTDARRASRNRAVRVAVGGAPLPRRGKPVRPGLGRAYSRSCLYLYLPLLGWGLPLPLPSAFGLGSTSTSTFPRFFWKTPSPPTSDRSDGGRITGPFLVFDVGGESLKKKSGSLYLYLYLYLPL